MRSVRTLGIVVLAQGGVLIWVLCSALYPVYTGTEIRLALAARDPRSLFQGQYARLTYQINSLPANLLKDKDKNLRLGETVYVTLGDSGKNIWTASEFSRKKPADKTRFFLRGKVAGRRFQWQDNIPVVYGIEAMFASPKRALEIEKIAARGIATLRVAPNGQAALMEVAAAGS